jgi:uncharacterized protein (DUF302 family)
MGFASWIMGHQLKPTTAETIMRQKLKFLGLGLIVFLTLATPTAQADDTGGMIKLEMNVPWSEAWTKLKAAIQKNKMGIVSHASASAGAKSRGVTIPGNMVVGVFRNDFAVRMLTANVDAGIEAPLRFYLTEDATGKVHLSYRKPGATFAPYDGKDLAVLARELDGIFSNIAHDATK